MKKTFALLVALVLAISAVSAVAYAQNPEEGPRLIILTHEARDIALADFDYIAAAIMEVAPTQNIIYRRLGVDAPTFFAAIREDIYEKTPFPSFLSLFDPERWGEAPTDDLYIAADYVFTVALLVAFELGSLGHMEPQIGPMVEQFLLGTTVGLHQLADPDTVAENLAIRMAGGLTQAQAEMAHQADLNNIQLRHALYTLPQVQWFYQLYPDAIDVNIDLGGAVGNMDPNNITTAIIEEGRIAYIHIASFLNNIALDAETLFPFYEEIQDFEHLIIDIRGNGGGWVTSFPTNVITMLIDEPITLEHYEFFIDHERTAGFFEAPLGLSGGIFQSVYTAEALVESRNMTQFNPQDLALLDYAIVWQTTYAPAENNIPFAGEIWLLIDGGTGSTAEKAASASLATGFATVVGEPTAGITQVIYTYAAAPNTGVLVRIDLGYTVTATGQSIEEFGVMPQIANASDMDALDTVLALINGAPVAQAPVQAQTQGTLPIPAPPAAAPTFVALRYVAYAHGYTVTWDGENNAAIIIAQDGRTHAVAVSVDGTFNDNGTVYITADLAEVLFS